MVRCRRGIFFWWPARLGSAWFVRSVAAAAGDLAGARGRRKEREKRGGRRPKAVFFESGREAPPPTTYTVVPPNAILGRGGGCPLCMLRTFVHALALSPISHGYNFLVFLRLGRFWALSFSPPFQNLNSVVVSFVPTRGDKLPSTDTLTEEKTDNWGRNLLTLGQCDKESGLVSETLSFFFFSFPRRYP